MNSRYEYVVEIKGLNVIINNRKILDNITFKVPRNVIFTIMGPSGSGKSTLLRVINKLIDLNPKAKYSGEVIVLGKNISNTDPYVLRREIGMVFQNPNPFPHMTIYDNVAIGVRINRGIKDKKKLDEIVEWALRKAMLWDEVKDRLKDYPSQLSGGQKQRLCLARAVAYKPKLLLLDEPTANIDPKNTVKIEESLLSLKNETTIIMVTHSKEQAKRISDYIAYLYMGRIEGIYPAGKITIIPTQP